MSKQERSYIALAHEIHALNELYRLLAPRNSDDEEKKERIEEKLVEVTETARKMVEDPLRLKSKVWQIRGEVMKALGGTMSPSKKRLLWEDCLHAQYGITVQIMHDFQFYIRKSKTAVFLPGGSWITFTLLPMESGTVVALHSPTAGGIAIELHRDDFPLDGIPLKEEDDEGVANKV